MKTPVGGAGSKHPGPINESCAHISSLRLCRLCVPGRCAVLYCSGVCCAALFRCAPLSALVCRLYCVICCVLCCINKEWRPRLHRLRPRSSMEAKSRQPPKHLDAATHPKAGQGPSTRGRPMRIVRISLLFSSHEFASVSSMGLGVAPPCAAVMCVALRHTIRPPLTERQNVCDKHVGPGQSQLNTLVVTHSLVTCLSAVLPASRSYCVALACKLAACQPYPPHPTPSPNQRGGTALHCGGVCPVPLPHECAVTKQSTPHKLPTNIYTVHPQPPPSFGPVSIANPPPPPSTVQTMAKAPNVYCHAIPIRLTRPLHTWWAMGQSLVPCPQLQKTAPGAVCGADAVQHRSLWKTPEQHEMPSEPLFKGCTAVAVVDGDGSVRRGQRGQRSTRPLLGGLVRQ